MTIYSTNYGGYIGFKRISSTDGASGIWDLNSHRISKFAFGWPSSAAAWVFQGSISGYTSGGIASPGPGYTNVIDKFPFASDSNASDVGDLINLPYTASGQSSKSSGYTSGGLNNGSNVNVIQKFPFSVDTNASDVGDLLAVQYYICGGSSSETNGYSTGGNTPSPLSSNVIEKFPFSTDTNASDVGDLFVSRAWVAGQTSTTDGYTSGGSRNPPTSTGGLFTIDKFPFASDSNASDVGLLNQARSRAVGQSSTDYGYTSGGLSSIYRNNIDKFPFATDTNASDVGDLTLVRGISAGQSSIDAGYTSGGFSPPGRNTIDKFLFASDNTTSDVGDLSGITSLRYGVSGQHI